MNTPPEFRTRSAARGLAPVVAAALAASCGTPGPSPLPPSPVAWHRVWADEFDGPTIDGTKWTHETFPGAESGNSELQHYTDRVENARIEEGHLVIEARRESFRGHEFTSARLKTQGKFSFLYGRIEARIRIPSTKGIWPAFWMMPEKSHYGPWPFSGEIDILEAVNKADRVYGTLHYGGPGHTFSGQEYTLGPPDKRVDFGDDFHVYAVEWEPEELRWYVDGVLFSSKTEWFTPKGPYPAPFDQPFYPILNVAVGGNWPGPPDATSTFPQRMLVDWVRVYRQDNEPPEIRILSPESGTVIPAGEDLEIRTEVSDPDGSVQRVDLVSEGTVVASAGTAPWTLTWCQVPDGCYRLRVVAVDDKGMRRGAKLALKAGMGCPRRPWGKDPIAIPGAFEAEHVDRGVEGEAWHDVDASNNGGKLRPQDGVDIGEGPPGTLSVGWTEPGEWMDYDIDVATDGEFSVAVVAASANSGGRISLTVGSESMSLDIPPTGDWARFERVQGGQLRLKQGKATLRIAIEKGGVNLDRVELERKE